MATTQQVGALNASCLAAHQKSSSTTPQASASDATGALATLVGVSQNLRIPTFKRRNPLIIKGAWRLLGVLRGSLVTARRQMCAAMRARWSSARLSIEFTMKHTWVIATVLSLSASLSFAKGPAPATAASAAAPAAAASAAKTPTAQQTLMGTCNTEATGKKGDERKAFMKQCLSDGKKQQQSRMKVCNAEAAGKKGDERKAFMSACLKK